LLRVRLFANCYLLIAAVQIIRVPGKAAVALLGWRSPDHRITRSCQEVRAWMNTTLGQAIGNLDPERGNAPSHARTLKN
jgi:hypothetical protein